MSLLNVGLSDQPEDDLKCQYQIHEYEYHLHLQFIPFINSKVWPASIDFRAKAKAFSYYFLWILFQGICIKKTFSRNYSTNFSNHWEVKICIDPILKIAIIYNFYCCNLQNKCSQIGVIMLSPSTHIYFQ